VSLSLSLSLVGGWVAGAHHVAVRRPVARPQHGELDLSGWPGRSLPFPCRRVLCSSDRPAPRAPRPAPQRPSQSPSQSPSGVPTTGPTTVPSPFPTQGPSPGPSRVSPALSHVGREAL
jgi:hypothetical protein